jgi:hypothetical protein
MLTADKEIWDSVYDEEYDALNDLPTWEVLTKSQFRSLSKGVKALPLMAIATIKYDANNRPKRVKYRIVVLGNLDYHNWSEESTAAPVMSQLELHLLTSLATYHHHVLKNCDFKQAFVQSSLPDDELYFVKPPVGSHHSPPGTIWKLTRSLYGLRCAPKLWFEKLCSHLKSMGLKNSDTSPCLFVGNLLEGGPPIKVISSTLVHVIKLNVTLKNCYLPLHLWTLWDRSLIFWALSFSGNFILMVISLLV